MKFAAIIAYGGERERLKISHPAHRDDLRTFLRNGQLWAAGPFTDDMGALWVIDADTEDAAQAIVRGDPFVEAGIIVGWTLHPIAYWSAREAKGLG